MQIAEQSHCLIPKPIREHIYFTFDVASFYYRMIREQYLIFFRTNQIDIYEAVKTRGPIDRNPVYQSQVGTLAYDIGEHVVAESWLKNAIDQDYYPAELVYSLVCKKEESCDHLLKGARGGHAESQVLLGLYYIYGINCNVDKKEGISWLEIAAYQEKSVAYLILATIYYFGYGKIPVNNEKATVYYNYYSPFTKGKGFEISLSLKNEIDRIMKKYGENLFYFPNKGVFYV